MAGRILSRDLPGTLARRAMREAELLPSGVDHHDPPWCRPRGASWTIYGDPATVAGTVLALWLQALHPLALAAMLEHSDFERDPIGRLIRTSGFGIYTTFAPGSRAAERCEQVRLIHGHIEGVAPDGRRYAAADPELLDWAHCAQLLGQARCWLVYGDHPDPRLLDEFVAEQARVPRALGDPSPPMSWRELLVRLDHFVPQLTFNDQTEWAGGWFANPTMGGRAQLTLPLYRLVYASAVAAAPSWARALWRVRAPREPARLAGHVLFGAGTVVSGSRWPVDTSELDT